MSSEIQKPIIVFPKGALSAKDKEKASKAGYLVLESSDPDKIRIIQPAMESLLPNDDFTMAAMAGLAESYSDSGKVKFFKEFHRAMKAKKGTQPEEGGPP